MIMPMRPLTVRGIEPEQRVQKLDPPPPLVMVGAGAKAVVVRANPKAIVRPSGYQTDAADHSSQPAFRPDKSRSPVSCDRGPPSTSKAPAWAALRPCVPVQIAALSGEVVQPAENVIRAARARNRVIDPLQGRSRRAALV